MPPAGFELAIPANERSQTFVLDRSATGMCEKLPIRYQKSLRPQVINREFCFLKYCIGVFYWNTAIHLDFVSNQTVTFIPVCIFVHVATSLLNKE